MDSNKLIIITADTADLKTINKLIFSLRDWEYSSEPHWDDCAILRTTQDISANPHKTDKPPIQELPPNDFRGKSMQEIESMMLAKHKEGNDGASLFLVLDREGVEHETIIVVERSMNPAEEPDAPTYLDRYSKARVPWIEAHIMWCNLDIANMGFEEFCKDCEVADDGWGVYQSIPGAEHYGQFVRKRDNVLRELAKLDLA